MEEFDDTNGSGSLSDALELNERHPNEDQPNSQSSKHGDSADHELSNGGLSSPHSSSSSMSRQPNKRTRLPPILLCPMPIPSIQERVLTETESVESSLSRPSLFEEIFKTGSVRLTRVVEVVLDKWIGRYSTTATSKYALIEVLELFLHVAGCCGQLSRDRLHSLGYETAIEEMRSQLNGFDYPIAMNKGSGGKGFLKWLCVFLEMLMDKCKSRIVFDETLVNCVSNFLILMSKSNTTAFRHTGTVAGLKLITGLASLVAQRTLDLNQNLKIRRLERLSSIDDEECESEYNCDILNNDLEELQNMLNYLFENIFKLRYRDKLVNIRIACLEEAEIWLTSYCSVFGEVQFQPYLKPLLLDKTQSCCKAAIRTLMSLYKNCTSTSPNLQTSPYPGPPYAGFMDSSFLECKEAIIGIAHLKTGSCSIDALRLLNCMQKHHPHLIRTTDADAIYLLLLSPRRDVAKEAGKFLNQRLTPEFIGRNPCNEQSQNERVLRKILKICAKHKFDCDTEPLECFVDATVDSVVALTDWATMCDMLLKFANDDDESSGVFASCLVDLIVIGITRISTSFAPGWLARDTKKPKKTVPSLSADTKESFCKVMRKSLSQLLDAYNTQTKMVVKLLTVVQHLNLGRYISNRQTKSTNDLVRSIQGIIERDREMAVYCASFLTILHVPASTITVSCQEKLEELLDSVENDCSNFSLRFRSSGSIEDSEELLKRLRKLDELLKKYERISVSCLEELIVQCKHWFCKEEYVLLPIAMSCCKSYFMWYFSSCARNDPYEMQFMRHIKEFLLLCQYMSESPNKEMQVKGFTASCDLIQVCYKFRKDELTARDGMLLETVNAMAHFIRTRVLYRDYTKKDSSNRMNDLSDNRDFLTSFGNLIMKGAISFYYASFLLCQLIKKDEYEDIIIKIFKAVKKFGIIKCGELAVTSLYQSFLDVESENKNIVKSKPWLALKGLTKKLDGLLGPEFFENQDAVVALHRRGIRLCTKGLADQDHSSKQPPKLLFLDVLSEFTRKMTSAMKNELLNYLDFDCLPLGRVEDVGQQWDNYTSYRRKLSGATVSMSKSGGGDEFSTPLVDKSWSLLNSGGFSVSAIQMDSTNLQRKRPASSQAFVHSSPAAKRLSSPVLRDASAPNEGDRLLRSAAKHKQLDPPADGKRPRRESRR